MKSVSIFVFCISILSTTLFAQEKSRYMGGYAELIEAPNGAIVNAEVLKTYPC